MPGFDRQFHGPLVAQTVLFAVCGFSCRIQKLPQTCQNASGLRYRSLCLSLRPFGYLKSLGANSVESVPGVVSWLFLAGPRTARRVSHHKFWLHKDGCWPWRFLRFHQAERELGGMLADRLAVLIDCRERHAQTIGVSEVATTDDRYVIGNSQPGIENGLHRSEGPGVVVAKHAIRNRPES